MVSGFGGFGVYGCAGCYCGLMFCRLMCLLCWWVFLGCGLAGWWCLWIIWCFGFDCVVLVILVGCRGWILRLFVGGFLPWWVVDLFLVWCLCAVLAVAGCVGLAVLHNVGF